MFLAVPSDCPLGPDGKKKSASKHSISGRTVTMYVSDWDGDDFVEACLPANLEDDGYNLVHTHDDYGAFILAGGARVGGACLRGAVGLGVWGRVVQLCMGNPQIRCPGGGSTLWGASLWLCGPCQAGCGRAAGVLVVASAASASMRTL